MCVVVRLADQSDLDAVKRLADAYEKQLGFVLRHKLQERLRAEELLVAQHTTANVVGFMSFHKKRNGWTAIYEIAVHTDFRRQGIAQQLISALGNRPLHLKCVAGLPANDLYAKLGFVCVRQEQRKRRVVNVWVRDTFPMYNLPLF